jgi:hypothetical protein
LQPFSTYFQANTHSQFTSNPEAILNALLRSLYSFMDSFFGLILCFGWSRCMDLAKNLFIGVVFQTNGIGWTLCVAEPIPRAKNGIHPGFFALRSFTELNGTVRTSYDTGPT